MVNEEQPPAPICPNCDERLLRENYSGREVVENYRCPRCGFKTGGS